MVEATLFRDRNLSGSNVDNDAADLHPSEGKTVQPLLRACAVAKRYGPTIALAGVELEIWSGEIVALVGANGSGKSTLTKIITGVIGSDEGRIEVNGNPQKFHSPRHAHRAGIRAAYQELSLFTDLSVEANIWMGHEIGRTSHDLGCEAMRKQTEELLANFRGLIGAGVGPTSFVKDLTSDERQIVEFLKALSAKPKVLILDEITASLDARQVERVFGIARSLKESGHGVVMITHRLSEVFELSDRTVVLRNGSIVGKLETNRTKSEDLVHLMVGDAVDAATTYYKRTSGGSADVPVLEAEVSVRSEIRPIHFTLHRGEVLGLGGLQGHGQREVLLSLFGLRNHTRRILVHGNSVRLRDSRDAVSSGIALVPGDRNREGNIAAHSILDNALLTTWREFRFGPFLRVGAARLAVDRLMKRLKLKARSLDDPVSSLSGGNAQKVVIGKWLMGSPSILLLDDPTKGIDVNAKKEFYALLMELKLQGLAVLFFSSDDDELTTLCDRVLVMYEGQIACELAHAQLSRETLVAATVQG
jgi:ribose transport system ATP-binding protein